VLGQVARKLLNMTSGLEKLAKADDITIVVKAEKDSKLRSTASCGGMSRHGGRRAGHRARAGIGIEA